jgi:methylated-DNA-[protein]-cysteine S-methyltransferase
MAQENIFVTTFSIKGITFTAIADSDTIYALLLNQKLEQSGGFKKLPKSAPQFFGLYDQLVEYFAGKRKEFELPVSFIGTDFEIKVWRQLLKIPYGKTMSYQDVAKKIKNPKAVRAVGGASGRNMLPIIIPCHRVINASGKLGGYAGGLEIKQYLLNLEKKGK